MTHQSLHEIRAFVRGGAALSGQKFKQREDIDNSLQNRASKAGANIPEPPKDSCESHAGKCI